MDPAGLDNPTAPWNIINGAAGHYDGLDTFHSIPYYSVQAWDKYVFFHLFWSGVLVYIGADEDSVTHSTYGWSRLTFHNRTHLTHEFVASANGSVLDTATLYKAHDFSNGNGNSQGNGN